MRPLLRLAQVQAPMAPTVADNVAFMVETLRTLQGTADAALFPECATTGFHRGLPTQLPHVDAGLKRLRDAVEATGVTAIVGTPRQAGARVFNAVAVLEPGVATRFIDKVGLTPSEARFFSAGGTRPVLSITGRSLSAVLCREVLDDCVIDAQLILWPGYIQWEGGPDDYLARAQDLARRCQATVVQANWPQSLNAPDTQGLGGSVVIGPSGNVRSRMPLDHVGLSVIEV